MRCDWCWVRATWVRSPPRLALTPSGLPGASPRMLARRVVIASWGLGHPRVRVWAIAPEPAWELCLVARGVVSCRAYPSRPLGLAGGGLAESDAPGSGYGPVRRNPPGGGCVYSGESGTGVVSSPPPGGGEMQASAPIGIWNLRPPPAVEPHGGMGGDPGLGGWWCMCGTSGPIVLAFGRGP